MLVPQYEAVSFAQKQAALLHLLPATPARVLDIGAGTGADAAWFADRGHTVVAVEPVAAFRHAAMELHRAPGIEWVDDSLPLLARVRQQRQCFDVVSLIAVWMHLDTAERATGMATLARLLDTNGVVLLTLRHGPVPAGRRMFAVSAQETIALAAKHGLTCVYQLQGTSVQAANRAAGVMWTSLAFRHGGAASRD